MPVVLVVIIAAGWIIMLGPSLLKRRAHSGGGINSISHFHRQLRVLENSGPKPIVAPAYRLHTVPGERAASSAPRYPEVSAVPVLTVVGAKELPRPALAFLGEPVEDPEDGRRSAVTPPRTGSVGTQGAIDDLVREAGRSGVELPGRSPDIHARHLARRRRRDTLGVLAMVFLLSFMVGFVPGATVVWAVTALSGVALVSYVALLVHMRRLAEERERKLHYLRPPAGDGTDPRRSPGMPVYSSGRYAHPSNGAAAVR